MNVNKLLKQHLLLEPFQHSTTFVLDFVKEKVNLGAQQFCWLRCMT